MEVENFHEWPQSYHRPPALAQLKENERRPFRERIRIQKEGSRVDNKLDHYSLEHYLEKLI